MESRLSRDCQIITIGLRVTRLICLVISLIILVTNVLKVPYGEDQIKVIHFYDVYGFKYMVVAILIVIVYSIIQTVAAIRAVMANRDPSFLVVYYGELVSSVMLFFIAVSGFSTTREYHKWLRKWISDDAREHEDYFLKSYACASVILVALICTFVSSIVFVCVFSRKNFELSDKKNTSKVNAVEDDQP